jgi:hypothetical protein
VSEKSPATERQGTWPNEISNWEACCGRCMATGDVLMVARLKGTNVDQISRRKSCRLWPWSCAKGPTGQQQRQPVCPPRPCWASWVAMLPSDICRLHSLDAIPNPGPFDLLLPVFFHSSFPFAFFSCFSPPLPCICMSFLSRGICYSNGRRGEERTAGWPGLWKAHSSFPVQLETSSG